MIILLSPADTMNEVLEWAILRISAILKIDPSDVKGMWTKNEKGLADASFEVNFEKVKEVALEDVAEVVKGVWTIEARPMLAERLAGLKQKRIFSCPEENANS